MIMTVKKKKTSQEENPEESFITLILTIVSWYGRKDRQMGGTQTGYHGKL